MKIQITRISVLQSSKIMTALYVVLGFVYSLIGIPMVIFGGAQFKIMGFIYICMPVLLGILGFIFLVLSAALYNGLAKWLGGVEFETTTVE